MCDRIRQDDERNLKMQNNEEYKKCLEFNSLLEKCLEISKRDFRMCKKELSMLRECMEKKKSQSHD